MQNSPLVDSRQPVTTHAQLLLVAVTGLVGTACDSSKNQAPSRPLPAVTAAEVLVTDVPIFGEYVGQTEASANVDVRARVQGYITKVSFVEGTNVMEGDPLFQIDREPVEQRLIRARAGLAEARAALEKTDHDIARYRPLVEQRAIPRQDLENAESANASAKAGVEAAQADVRQAELELGYTDVRAPISGLIGEKFADQGALVGGLMSTALATISPLDPIRFSSSITEVEYLEVRSKVSEEKVAEMPVRMILANGIEHPATGHFIFGDRVVDSRTGTLRVRAEFRNPTGVLRPGQFGRIRVLKSIRKDAILVPQRSVQEVQGTYSVFTVTTGGDVVYSRVTPSLRIGSLWVIDAGLKKGDRVVVEGLLRLRDGVAVTATSTTIDDSAVDELRKLVPTGT